MEHHIEDLKTKDISDEELEEAKTKYRLSLYSMIDDEISFSIELKRLYNMPNGIDNLPNLFDIIDSITKEDIKKAMNYIAKDKPDYLINADTATINQNQSYINSLGKIRF